MADTLYLSLWYPNLRLAGLAEKLTAVLGAFATHGGEARVYSATVVAGELERVAGVSEGIWARRAGLEPKLAVEDALELLHEDYAYEFQIGWSLWEPEVSAGTGSASLSFARTPEWGRRSSDTRWARE